MPTATSVDGVSAVRRSVSWPNLRKGEEEDDIERRGSVGVGKDNQFMRAGWASLFAFTTKKHVSSLMVAVLFAAASGIVVPALAQFLGKFFELYSQFGAGTLSSSDFLQKSKLYAVALVGLGAGSWLLNGGFYMSWIIFGELQAKCARERLFNGLLEKELEWYDMRKHGIGALIPRIQTQIRELQISVSQPFGTLVEYVVTACASLGLAFYNSWKLTLVILSTLPVAAVAVTYLSRKTQAQIEAQIEALTRAAKVTTTAFTAVEAVKCFNGEDSEVWKYRTMTEKAARCYLYQAHFNAIMMAFLKVFTLVMFVQGFWYGTTLVDHGTSAGQMFTTFMAALSATEAIQGIVPQLLVLEKGRRAGATLRIIMTNVESDGNVTFAYPTRPTQLALDNASFDFKPGQITFIVGKSGSGKSTIGQLLTCFYSPSLGEITLDGIPLHALNLEWLRSNVTLVEQQSTLFQETMLYNIALGRKDFENVRREEVKEAADFALLQQTINELPEGLDTIVGAKGASMSGGQRQRMAIARARLRDTPVLMLDECTSALDHLSSTLIMDAIRVWRQGRTTIIITHDTSHIRPGDYAYVMEDGRVVQHGYREQMERMTNSPFRAFMPLGQHRGDTGYMPHSAANSVDIRTRSLSVDSFGLINDRRRSSASVDSLEIYLDQPSPKRMSQLPSALIHRISAMPTALGPLSSRPSSSWKTDMFPFGSSATPKVSSFNRSSPFISSPSASGDYDGDTRNSVQLLEMTALAAMDNRISSTRHRRFSSATRLSRRKSASLAVTPEHRKSRCHTRSHSKIFTAQRSKEDQPPLDLLVILRSVWPILNWKLRLSLVFAFIFATIVAISTPLFSYVFAQLLATFYITENRSKLALKWSVIVLGIACADAVATYLMNMLLQYCGQNWVDRIRTRAIRSVLEQPREFFDKEQNSVSRLADNLDRNAEEMRALVGRFIGFIYVAITMVLFALTWSLIICWKLTLVTLSAGPFMYGVTVGFENVSAILEGRTNDATELNAAIFTETFVNIKSVRTLTLERFFQSKYTEATNSTLQIGRKRALYAGFFYGLSESGVILINALVFYYGSRLVVGGDFTVKQILEVFSMLLFTVTTVNGIIGYIPQMSSARDSASRLLRLTTLPQQTHENSGTTRIPTVGTIALTDLSFAYPSRPNNDILHSVSLSIPSNTSTAIVGYSGSGKSTIAALLLKLYSTGPVQLSGHPPITLSGRDIRRVHTPTLRSLISVVSQTPTLFPLTIAENIAYGIPDDSPLRRNKNIRSAAAAAGIDGFIESLPIGYATVIGEGGMGLSGGQAQRVAIARALARQPRVLILDEATSALDVESAGIIRDSIQRLIEARSCGKHLITVIIITHSREMMSIADNIVMLDQGRVVDEGGFNELLEKKGEFAKLLGAGDLADGGWND